MTVAILDGWVHALDLIVGPEMFGLGEAIFDIVMGAGHDKSERPEELLPLDLLLDVSRYPTVVGRIGEVSAIVREDGVNLISTTLMRFCKTSAATRLVAFSCNSV
ncbi:hypothetical protein XH98_20825 [Bradyrhizobium sp. CCBAU 51745]|nr:hypothetical protein [Bradyrhizobium sp. CCBAU 51745]